MSSQTIIGENEGINNIYIVLRGSIMEKASDLVEDGVHETLLNYDLGCIAGLQYCHPSF